MAKKYYVVWNGRETGIYDNWELVSARWKVLHRPYTKLFKIRGCRRSFSQGSEAFLNPKEHPMQMIFDALYGSPIIPSISVDGACNGKTKQAEYQGVDTKSKQRIFHKGPFPEGTNNIMEFLALVHALSYCKRHHLDVPIYSDSVTAIKWVKTKKARSKMSLNPQNAPLFALIERAEKWLKNNTYTNQILKWETQTWGEIPADFGRK